jgi:hypothetical protein
MARDDRYGRMVARAALRIVQDEHLDLVDLAEAGSAGFVVSAFADDATNLADVILDGQFS